MEESKYNPNLKINLSDKIDGSIELETREKAIRERAKEIMQDWFENAPVCLATSSEVRKKGVIEEGFAAENIQLIAMPDALEGLVLEYYLETAEGNRGTGTRGMEEVADAKSKFLPGQGVPDNSFLFAFDTLPVYYTLKQNVDVPELRWRGKTEKKPRNLEQRKQIIRNTFLNIIKNYLEYKDFLNVSPVKKSDDEMYKKMDFATGIHVKTAFAMRFPYERMLTSVDSDRVIVKPHRLYELADKIDLQGENIVGIVPEDLLNKKLSDGKILREEIDTIIDEITKAMEDNNIDPFKISGGIAYHLDGVKDILKVEEAPNVIDSEKLDTSIYTGFPKNLFRKVLSDKAYALARAEFDKK